MLSESDLISHAGYAMLLKLKSLLLKAAQKEESILFYDFDASILEAQLELLGACSLQQQRN